MRPAVLLLVLGITAGCGESGRLVIALERPSGSLDPLADRRLSRFSLRVTENGQSTDQEAVWGESSELHVGGVPVDRPVDLRLAGRSSTGLMLGLGQVLELTVSATEETRVAVNFRKPLGYVAGLSRVQVLDAAVESSSSLELPSIAVSAARDVAAAANGALLLVVSGSRLVPVRTSDHAVLPDVALSATGGCAGASPSSLHAVVCLPKARKVSIIDLREVAAGVARERAVAVPGEPSRVVFGADRRTATVLLDAEVPASACRGGTSSSLVDVDLQTGSVSPPRRLSAAVADVALDPRDGALLLSLPCEAKLRRLRAGAAAEDVSVPATYDLALADRTLVLLGPATGAPVRGRVVLFDLSSGSTLGNPQSRDVKYPPIQLAFRPQSTSMGFFYWVSEPKSLTIHDVAVTPDGQRAICLAEAEYASSVALNSCVFRTQLKASSYMLLDLTIGGILVQRFTRLTFTDCHANCLRSASGQTMDNFQVCVTELQSALARSGLLLDQNSQLDPSGTALLFGGT